MFFFPKRTIFLVFFVFVSSFFLFADSKTNGDDTDIFASQKIVDGDFLNIKVEPSKKELQSENEKFFEDVKRKKLEILKKLEKEQNKIDSAKKNVLAKKDKQRAQLEKNKSGLKAKPESDSSAGKKSEPLKENEAGKKSEPLKENKAEKKSDKIQNDNEEKDSVKSSEEKIDSLIFMRENFINCGLDYRGIRYVWGGKTPVPGFDCSGLITYTAKKSLDIDLQGNAQDIYNKTSPVSLSQAQPGDLIFFKGDSDTRITHVGIYLGKNPSGNDFGKQNLFLNAASAGPRTGVIISGLDENYWKKTFYGCGRIIPEF